MSNKALIDRTDIDKELELYSLGDPTGSVDPNKVYGELLAESPIYTGDVQVERLGLEASTASAHDGPQFTVLGFEEASDVLHRSDVFSGRFLLLQQGKNMGETILTMDDPKHRVHRLLVQRAFTRKAMEGWRERFVEPLVERMLDQLESAGSMEFVADFARPLPVAVIQEILGLPMQQLPELNKLAAGLMLGLVQPELAAACGERVAELLAVHLEARRAEPKDDVVSILVNEQLSTGEVLTDEEILNFLRLLLPAGAETTARLLSSGMVRILTEPGVRPRLRADEGLLRLAITETLRLHPPFQNVWRLSLEDTTVNGFEIPANSAVTVCISAANRDPRKFPSPDTYDLDRTGTNLGFGLGMHICLGVHLARMENEVALRALLSRFPRLRLDPDMPPPVSRGVRLASPVAVHLRWD